MSVRTIALTYFNYIKYVSLVCLCFLFFLQKKTLDETIWLYFQAQVQERRKNGYKKATDFVQKLDESLQRITEAFEICPEIKKVAISVGATSASPKELYLIHLPPLNPEAENLSGNFCVKVLFRQLLSEDPLRDMKPISPTNIFIFLLAPRQSSLRGFFPKPTYRIPVRGNRVQFHLQSNCGQSSHDLSTDFSIIELSGFEPFDMTCDTSTASLTNLEHHSSEESVSADYVCVGPNESLSILDRAPFSTDTPSNKSPDCEHTPDYDATELVASTSNSCKRLKKSSSASSILSHTSVIAKAEKQCNITRDFVFVDSEFIWFQSPVTMKGYKMTSKT